MDEQVNNRKISFRLADPRADIVNQIFQNVKHSCYLMNRDFRRHALGKGKENILLGEVKT